MLTRDPSRVTDPTNAPDTSRDLRRQEEQPVVLSRTLESYEHVRPVQAPAMEHHFDLLLIPVLCVVRPAVPDGDHADPVLTFRDLS
jgi:hypothetical protein